MCAVQQATAALLAEVTQDQQQAWAVVSKALS